MSYKIVVDSCCDLPEEYRKDPRFEIVPLGLEVGDYHIMDDENFNQKEFLEKVAASDQCPKSACPSPDRYMRAYTTDAEDVYAVTLSSHLSGSYNSAILGKEIYHEELGDKNIYVADSLSACCGETQIALKAMELAESGLTFDEVVPILEAYRDKMNTYFVLDNLDTLRKNGRLSGMKAFVASTLNIKPICAGNHGDIVQRGQGVGIKKALIKMTDLVIRETEHPEEKRLMISHCNCFERAMVVKDMIMAKASFQDVIVVDTAGVATMYANDGGIVVTC